jgi:hypothetical protein
MADVKPTASAAVGSRVTGAPSLVLELSACLVTGGIAEPPVVGYVER